MHRFYIDPDHWNLDALALRGAEGHHARDVLRVKSGDRVVVFNGRGHEVTAEVIDLPRGEIRLRKLHDSKTPPLRCRITLAQAIPKGKNMDLIVQKAVEIGAAEIAPLISERTIVELDAEAARQKQLKWRQIAIEAAKQCGQNWLPEVRVPRKPKDFFAEDVVAALVPSADADNRRLTQTPLQLRLIGSLQPDARHFKKVLAEYVKETGSPPRTALMLIGPEGDFTPAELALARSNGCLPITLGPIILRVETAAIYCLSVLSVRTILKLTGCPWNGAAGEAAT